MGLRFVIRDGKNILQQFLKQPGDMPSVWSDVPTYDVYETNPNIYTIGLDVSGRPYCVSKKDDMFLNYRGNPPYKTVEARVINDNEIVVTKEIWEMASDWESICRLVGKKYDK